MRTRDHRGLGAVRRDHGRHEHCCVAGNLIFRQGWCAGAEHKLAPGSVPGRRHSGRPAQVLGQRVSSGISGHGHTQKSVTWTPSLLSDRAEDSDISTSAS